MPALLLVERSEAVRGARQEPRCVLARPNPCMRLAILFFFLGKIKIVDFLFIFLLLAHLSQRDNSER